MAVTFQNYNMPIRYMLIQFILIFSCAHQNVKANDDIYFYNLGAKDGLSQINIMSIYQDEFGVVWFGSTEGFNRYNGNEIEVFRPDRSGVGLSQNTIFRICGNKSGLIYLLNEKDLVRYDIYKQQFENIRQGDVNAIAYEHDILWVVLENKITRYDEHSGQFGEYLTLNEGTAAATFIYPAKDGTVWVGTSSGLYVVSDKAPERQASIIGGINVSSIYQDSKGNLWIGTSQDGVYRIDPSGHIINYRHQYGVNSLSHNQVRAFEEDNSGNIWIATFYGLNMFAPQTGEWKQYVSNDNLLHSLSHSSVFSLYKDKQGTIWVGTYFGGVNYFNPDTDIFRYYESKSAFPNHLSFPYVGRMTEDKHGNLWVCTEGGTLNCLNLQTRQFTRYLLNRSNPDSVIGYNQKSIWYREDKDLLYIGIHNGGLAIFDNKTKSSRILTSNANPYALLNNTINKMQYHDGWLYLMTQSGLVKMDIETEQFLRMDQDSIVGKYLTKGIGVGFFYIDTQNRLWLIRPFGLAAINLKTGKLDEFVHDHTNARSIGYFNVVDVFENRKGELFFATIGSGIFKYNPESKDFDNYTQKSNGLLSDYCYGISGTPSGKLILLHNKGFAFFDPENPGRDIFRSSPNFPIVGFNLGNSSYVTRDGEIFIGGINGLVSFEESDLDKINKDYTLFLDKLFINNQRVYPGDRFGVLKETLPLCNRIELKHNQNNIAIEFAVSNYLQTMTQKYEYKLEGFDQDWMPTEENTISYTNLDTGEYTLYVREVSWAGVETGKEYALDIRINPPFYLTTIAFLIYGALIVLAIIGVFRFYLWRTRLETTLEFERKDKERIEELNRVKLRFFTNVSHEFRTPLTLIIGQIEALLIQSDLSAKVLNKLNKVHKNAKHLLNLITELLDFRKQEQGFYRLKIKRVELIAYLNEIYTSFNDHGARRKIKLRMDYIDEEIYVYIDPANFRKAIFNLLSNAFKYTSEGGEITLKIRTTETEVHIQVIDSGIGIPPQSLSKIFELFYQLEYRTSELTLGTGIGLALTKEIISSHKGRISVESTLNEGSIFTIVLKLGASHFSDEELNYKNSNAEAVMKDAEHLELDDEQPALSQEMVETDAGIDGEKPTVLLIDDNQSLLEMLRDSLSAYYKVFTAIDGQEGLDMVYKIQPDLVISDIMMPKLSGKELCYRMKNNVLSSHIPIILLTAQASDSQIIDGYMFGADAYITKPFNFKMLVSQCNNLIKNRQILYKKFVDQSGSITPFNVAAEQDQILMDKVVKIVRDNFSNPDFDMNKLGAELGIGRTKLYAKIKEITGFTPNELTLNLKLQEAASLLDNSPHKNVSEIAYEMGFSSTKYFTRCFKTFYNMVPQDWRKRNKARECS